MGLLRFGIATASAMVLLAGTAAAQGAKPLKKCAPDAVVVGATCMDRYEASVWRVPNPTTTSKSLVSRIQTGKASLVLMLAFGATQLGGSNGDYLPCAESGQDCGDIFAVSLPNVIPSTRITWFQAQQACKNARKRLPTNAEWQDAVAGTPNAGPDNGTTHCNTDSAGTIVPGGSRTACVSSMGAFDMVGNVAEWVADWVPHSEACAAWSAPVAPGELQCLAGASADEDDAPGALERGGRFSSGELAGPLSISGQSWPTSSNVSRGFRCAR